MQKETLLTFSNSGINWVLFKELLAINLIEDTSLESPSEIDDAVELHVKYNRQLVSQHLNLWRTQFRIVILRKLRMPLKLEES